MSIIANACRYTDAEGILDRNQQGDPADEPSGTRAVFHGAGCHG